MKKLILPIAVILVGLVWVVFRGPALHAPDALQTNPTPAVTLSSPARIHPIAAPAVAETPTPAPPQRSTPVALSSAVPSLTLEGSLEQHFQWIASRKRWQGDPNEVTRAPGASKVKSLKLFNPEGKPLTIEQEHQLQEIIDAFDAKRLPIHAAERKETVQALARAAAAGRIESIELATPNTQDAIVHNRAHEANYAKVRELQQRLTNQYGREGIDWAYAQAPSSAPDGISRSNIIYFFPANEPEVFRLRALERSLIRESHDAYTKFFEQIH